jgi:dihydrofolate reductase
MGRIVGFIAMSLDGYIAEPGGGLSFLDDYPAESPEYDAFIAGVGTVVMGRDTYDVVRRHMDWPYADKHAIIVTTRPAPDLVPGAEIWSSGEVDGLLAHLRSARLPDGDIWILGGGRLQQAFLDRGAIERLDLFILPEILGGGIPMIPPGAGRRRLKLLDLGTWGKGVVRAVYGC